MSADSRQGGGNDVTERHIALGIVEEHASQAREGLEYGNGRNQDGVPISNRGRTRNDHGRQANGETISEHARRRRSRGQQVDQRRVGRWLRVGSYKTRGVKFKAAEAQRIMEEEDLDLLALQETFLTPEKSIRINANCIILSNPPPSLSSRPGGGSAILIRNRLAFKELGKRKFDCNTGGRRHAGCSLHAAGSCLAALGGGPKFCQCKVER